MALATLANLKLLRGITDASQDALLNMLLTAAQAEAVAYCKRALEQATYTEYYSGSGKRDFTLREYPVSSITSLYLDLGGYYGQAPNAFASNTLLTSGTDYLLQFEEGGSTSGSGIVSRISGTFGGFTAGQTNLQQMYGGGTLTQQGALPTWPARQGCIKVTYVAGYNASGSPAVPADLSQAILDLANIKYLTRKTGGQLYQSEALGKYNYSLQVPSAGEPPAIGSIREVLGHYRQMCF